MKGGQKMPRMYRHGDVLLIERTELPKDAKLIGEKRVVLAEGEVTGHAHVIESSSVKMWSVGEQCYVVTDDRPAERTVNFTTELGDLRTVTGRNILVHEEHGPIAIEPGIYERIIQRTYSPERISRVVD